MPKFNTANIINRIQDEDDRKELFHDFESLESQVLQLTDERDYLRSQITLAIRSFKFDLHPEIRLS